MRAKTVFTDNRGRMDDKPRYETCEQCGQCWNVSRQARLYAGVYICPECAGRNRRGGDGHDRGRGKARPQ